MTSRPERGMVVSAHPLASRAGAAVLRKGGNAVDAAVATSLMLGVVEPAFSGIGGGGFAVIHIGDEDAALDYRETAPAGATEEMFSAGTNTNRAGPLAIATPGLIAGHARLLEDYGTMRFADLASAAIRVARAGFSQRTLSRRILRDKASWPYEKISRFPFTSEVFLGKRRFPLLAKTLDTLADVGLQGFYHGEIPRTLAGYVRGIGGVLSEEDFSNYAPKQRKPAEGEYAGFHVVSMPPPSAGGSLLIHGLQVAEALGSEGLSDSDLPLTTAGILRLILGERRRFGDPDFGDLDVSSFLSTATAEKAARELRSGAVSGHLDTASGPGSTSHFSVVDTEGNAVAATETVECYYGSGVTVPGVGILMNDEMHDFDTEPGRPNSVAPGKRPASSMSPTILLKDGSPFLVLGGAGSDRIIGSVFQTVRNVVEDRMTLRDAVSRPRVHFASGRLEVEGGQARLLSRLNSAFTTHLRKRWDMYFGGVHALMVEPGTGKVTGAADPRRLGAAVAA